jgi:hypothetical protein
VHGSGVNQPSIVRCEVWEGYNEHDSWIKSHVQDPSSQMNSRSRSAYQFASQQQARNFCFSLLPPTKWQAGQHSGAHNDASKIVSSVPCPLLN